MPLPGDLLALLNACRADPVSDLPRLVLADWLDEHDDPARAELLRVQCELARPSLDTERVAELKSRERTLIVANWRAWAGSLHEACCDMIDAENLARYEAVVPNAGGVRAAPYGAWDQPIPRDDPFESRLPWKFTRGLIRLTNPHPIGALRAWSNGEELPWLDTLRMRLSNEFIALIDPSWVIPRKLIPYLSFGGTLRRPLTASEVAARENLQATFDGAHTASELERIVCCPRWRWVRHLVIDGEGFDDDIAFRAAVQQANYAQVTHLKLGSAEVASVLMAKRFMKLVSLDVGGAGVPPETLLAFAKRAPRLNVLIAWRTPLGDRHFAALLATSWGETLHALEVMNCDLGDDAMTALVRSGLLGRLYGPQLNLSMNRVGDAGLATLAGSEDLLHFSELVLRENRVGDAGVEALAASPFAANLRYLDLWKNRLTDRAALALAASPHLGRLRDLNVRDNDLTDAGRAALTARYGAVAKVGF